MDEDHGLTEDTIVIPSVVDASIKAEWTYIAPDNLDRKPSDIVIWSLFEKALSRLNPVAASNPNFYKQVRSDLENLIYGGMSLIDANERFTEMAKGKYSLPFGENNAHITVRLFDFDHPENNSFIVSDHIQYPRLKEKGGREFDLVYYVNGIPLIVGEAKTPFSPSISAYDGALDITETYIKVCESFFKTNLFCFATEGKSVIYGPIGLSAIKWGPWLIDGLSENGTIENAMQIIESLLKKDRALDILYNFNVFTVNSSGRKVKVLCRYQQYDGANKIVARVRDGRIRKGLIWHFQGSGKTYLMVFAAQKLRTLPELRNPTVMIVIDRLQLDSQSYTNFINCNTPNVVSVDKSKELEKLIEHGAKKIIITTIQKFDDVHAVAREDENLVVFVDEAHRSQYHIQAQRMRDALPGAFIFGFTGTPVTHKGRDTFYTFGSEEDPHGYLSRYGYEESVRDHETLPMHFEISKIQSHINVDALNRRFKELVESEGLTEEQARKLSDEASRINHILSQPDIVKLVCEDIAEHFMTKVQPTGFKAMIVAADRNLCVLYKNELDHILDSSMTAIDMTVEDSKKEPEYQKWKLGTDEEKKLLERYNDPQDPLKILIVTNKLLTGFDAPILQTMYLVKRLKEHNLLQAICRTNRVYTPDKDHGLIVDYMGVFKNVKNALKYSGEDVGTTISNVEVYKGRFSDRLNKCLGYFQGIDRTSSDPEVFKSAQISIKEKAVRDAFGKDFIELQKDWEAISPDEFLTPYTDDYVWLCKVYMSVRPPGGGRLIWREFGSKTVNLIHENIESVNLEKSDGTLILDEKIIRKALVDTSYEYVSRVIGDHLNRSVTEHEDDPFYISLGNRLKEVQEKYEREQIDNERFLQQLIKLATELNEEEQRREHMKPLEITNLALTRLFNKVKENNPNIDFEVGEIVNGIDDIVINFAFKGWETREQVKKEVRRQLTMLLRYKYDHDFGSDLVEKAYEYILTYYRQ